MWCTQIYSVSELRLPRQAYSLDTFALLTHRTLNFPRAKQKSDCADLCGLASGFPDLLLISLTEKKAELPGLRQGELCPGSKALPSEAGLRETGTRSLLSRPGPPGPTGIGQEVKRL